MSGTRVLIVDDDPDALRNLADILCDRGYAVDMAADGAAGLETFARNRYDLALLDLRMPRMNGIELLRRMRDHRTAVVAVLTTGYPRSREAARACELGAWQVVAKPLNLSRLLPLIEKSLARPRVLVVEDDASARKSLWDLLNHHHYRVSTVAGLSGARRTLAGQGCDLALISLDLPDRDHAVLFREMRVANPCAQTVLISGYPVGAKRVPQPLNAERAGPVLFEPSDPRALLETLARLTDLERRPSRPEHRPAPEGKTI